MKKITSLFLVFLLSAVARCFAIDHSDKLVSLASLTRETTTQQTVSGMFGQPVKIEESRKKVWWHYSTGSTNLVFCWNKKSDELERCSFSCTPAGKCVFDERLSRKLQSGSTNLLQALNLLGTPKDLKIKGATQEVYYAYQNTMLRLFFRDRVLVDYTLIGQVKQ